MIFAKVCRKLYSSVIAKDILVCMPVVGNMYVYHVVQYATHNNDPICSMLPVQLSFFRHSVAQCYFECVM